MDDKVKLEWVEVPTEYPTWCDFNCTLCEHQCAEDQSLDLKGRCS